MDLMANPSNRKEGAILISVTMKKGATVRIICF
jgi:hypothetical protein